MIFNIIWLELQMKIINLKDCKQFTVGDGSFLREVFNPKKDNLNIRYSLAQAQVQTGQKTKPHKLKYSEIYYVLRGVGIMHIDKEENVVRENDAVYIPPGTVQWVENIGKRTLDFLCIVDPAWEPECEEIMK